MSKKEELLSCIRNAYNYNIRYVGVLTKNTRNKFELIVFQQDSFKDKVNYYSSLFDDNLFLKKNKKVVVIDFCCANNLEEMEMELLTK